MQALQQLQRFRQTAIARQLYRSQVFRRMRRKLREKRLAPQSKGVSMPRLELEDPIVGLQSLGKIADATEHTGGGEETVDIGGVLGAELNSTVDGRGRLARITKTRTQADPEGCVARGDRQSGGGGES